MPIDHVDLDHQLRAAWTDWRAALAELGARPSPDLLSPLERWPALRRVQTLEQLSAHADEPLAVALYGWVRALYVEHEAWSSRVDEALGWVAPARVLEVELPLGELRRRAIRTTDPTERAGWARALAAGAGAVAPAIRRSVERRADCERTLGPPGERLRGAAGVEAGTAARVAEALLVATEPVAHDLAVRHYWDGLHAALGRAADAGWPAALTPRSTRELLGALEGRGVRRSSFAVPEAWGALSFARALGNLGVAWLDAERAAAREFAPVVRPHGFKRHERFALLASVVAERPFARRELGLGLERAREHQRAIARAFVRSLRFDALRVLVGQALAGSAPAAEQRFHELAPRVFGASVPSELMGVVPAVGVGAAPTLVGRVLGVRARQAALERFGEDWYRNPRCSGWLRECARRPEGTEPPSDDLLLGAVGELGRALEALC